MSIPVSKPVLGVQIRRTEILVGEEVFELREPGITATHALLEAVFDDELISAITDITDLINERDTEKKAIDELTALSPDERGILTKETLSKFMKRSIPKIVLVVKKAALPLLSRKMGLVSALLLDTKENRDRIKLSSAEFREWICENITPSQAVYVLTTMKDLIDWSDLGKKLTTLLPTSKVEPERQAPQTSA